MYIWQTEERQSGLHVYIAVGMYKPDEKLCTIIWWTCLFGKRWTGKHKDVRLDTHRDSLSRSQLHLLAHTQGFAGYTHTHTHTQFTHQGIKHKDVVVVGLGVFHHNVEQGIQSVLQKLHTHKYTDKWDVWWERTHVSRHTYTKTHTHHWPWPPPRHQWFWVSPGFLWGVQVESSTWAAPVSPLERRDTHNIFCSAVFT